MDEGMVRGMWLIQRAALVRSRICKGEGEKIVEGQWVGWVGPIRRFTVSIGHGRNPPDKGGASSLCARYVHSIRDYLPQGENALCGGERVASGYAGPNTEHRRHQAQGRLDFVYILQGLLSPVDLLFEVCNGGSHIVRHRLDGQ